MDNPPGGLRASDADRDKALAELTDAFQAGRVTADEFDERSGQILSSRTRDELSAPLADLPKDRSPATRSAAPVLATRIVAGASAVAAVSLAGVAVSDALGSGSSGSNGLDSAQKRQLADHVLRSLGLHISVPRVPAAPPPGFDWVGTLTPAAFAAALILLTIVLLLAGQGRPRRSRTAG
jgi:hypothetical protein